MDMTIRAFSLRCQMAVNPNISTALITRTPSSDQFHPMQNDNAIPPAVLLVPSLYLLLFIGEVPKENWRLKPQVVGRRRSRLIVVEIDVIYDNHNNPLKLWSSFLLGVPGSFYLGKITLLYFFQSQKSDTQEFTPMAAFCRWSRLFAPPRPPLCLVMLNIPLIFSLFHSNVERLHGGFLVLKGETCESSYIYESESGADWLRTHPGVYLKGFPHSRVMYCCVHNRWQPRTERWVALLFVVFISVVGIEMYVAQRLSWFWPLAENSGRWIVVWRKATIFGSYALSYIAEVGRWLHMVILTSLVRWKSFPIPVRPAVMFVMVQSPDFLIAHS